MSELKPCPFCSAEPEVLSDRYRTWGVVQHNEGCLFPAYPKHEISESDFTAWNTRYQCGLTDDDYSILLDELGVSERTCECVAEYTKSPIDGKTIVLHRCSACHELMRPFMNYCPNCGARVVG